MLVLLYIRSIQTSPHMRVLITRILRESVLLNHVLHPPISPSHAVCTPATFLASAFLASPTFRRSSALFSRFVTLCPIGTLPFPPFSSLSLSSSSINLVFRMASSRSGTSSPCRRASLILSLLTLRPLAADLTSFANRSRMAMARSSVGDNTGGRSEAGGPKGAMMEVTTCRIRVEQRYPEEMRTTSPRRREEFGSATR